jgi:hypothetical protein
MKRKMNEGIVAVLANSVGAIGMGANFAKPMSAVKNPLGGTAKFSNHLGQRIVSPLGADLLKPARAASATAMGAIAGAALVGAGVIAHTANEGAKAEARENANRDTPAVGLGKKTKYKAGTTRRIQNATRGY